MLLIFLKRREANKQEEKNYNKMNFFDIQLHQKKNMNVVRLIDKDIVSYTMCKQTYIQVADRGKIENEWLYTTKTTTTTKETKLTGQ